MNVAAGRPQLVGRDEPVQEHVAEEREAGVEVERRVQDRRRQHDRVRSTGRRPRGRSGRRSAGPAGSTIQVSAGVVADGPDGQDQDDEPEHRRQRRRPERRLVQERVDAGPPTSWTSSRTADGCAPEARWSRRRAGRRSSARQATPEAWTPGCRPSASDRLAHLAGQARRHRAAARGAGRPPTRGRRTGRRGCRSTRTATSRSAGSARRASSSSSSTPLPKPPVTTLSSNVTTSRLPRAASRMSCRSSGLANRALMTPTHQPSACERVGGLEGPSHDRPEADEQQVAALAQRLGLPDRQDDRGSTGPARNPASRG